MMVMQVALRKRVDRHHPELLGQPVGALLHVRTVSAKALLGWLICLAFMEGAQLLPLWCLVGVGFPVCSFCGCAWELNEALSQLVSCFFVLMVRMVMVMVMQVPLRQRVDRHHPELLGQPVKAQLHVRTVSVRRRR